MDIDFQHDRREEVIAYCKEVYGEESVSRIITFGTLASRVVVRDVARVNDYPYALGDKIAKAIPQEVKMTLKKALDISAELKQMYTSDKDVRKIIDYAFKLEGVKRNASIHACGELISRGAVSDVIPQVFMEDDKTGKIEATTQFNMSECEDMGILKIDFLGLRTMTAIGRALELINKKNKIINSPEVTVDEINIFDPYVYEYISKGHTEGVFQLESPGMTSFMMDLFQDVSSKISIIKNRKLSKEDEEIEMGKFGEELFERLIAGISLYRPGPIDEIPNYIKNMLNPSNITYLHPELKPILENTYGVIIYQEQCMEIVKKLAGFTKGQADSVRKAFAKKKEAMIKPLGQMFIYGKINNGKVITPGCLRLGIDKETAETIWAKMEKFGSYAFNKSHASGYAVISITTGSLSLYYKPEFFCATLNAYIDSPNKIKSYLNACKKLNQKILTPNVNISEDKFTISGDDIVFGLRGIKNVGKTSCLIVEERGQNGTFISLQNFIERMIRNQRLDKTSIESLINSGTTDTFGTTRRANLSIVESMVKRATLDKKKTSNGQLSLFDVCEGEGIEELKEMETIKIENKEEFPKKVKLKLEKEVTGFYLSEHPLDEYEDYLKTQKVIDTSHFATFTNEGEEDSLVAGVKSPSLNGKYVKIAGVITNMNTYYTKKDGRPMKAFNLEDKLGEVKCVVFPNDLEKFNDVLFEDRLVLITGQVKEDDRGIQIAVKSVVDLEYSTLTAKSIIIRGNKNIDFAREQWKKIVSLNKNYITSNGTKIEFLLGDKIYNMKENIKYNKEYLSKIYEICGEGNVNIKW